jgi:hypothetical protein
MEQRPSWPPPTCPSPSRQPRSPTRNVQRNNESPSQRTRAAQPHPRESTQSHGGTQSVNEEPSQEPTQIDHQDDLSASAMDNKTVPTDLTKSCKRFINSKTVALAEQELNL